MSGFVVFVGISNWKGLSVFFLLGRTKITQSQERNRSFSRITFLRKEPVQDFGFFLPSRVNISVQGRKTTARLHFGRGILSKKKQQNSVRKQLLVSSVVAPLRACSPSSASTPKLSFFFVFPLGESVDRGGLLSYLCFYLLVSCLATFDIDSRFFSFLFDLGKASTGCCAFFFP